MVMSRSTGMAAYSVIGVPLLTTPDRAWYIDVPLDMPYQPQHWALSNGGGHNTQIAIYYSRSGVTDSEYEASALPQQKISTTVEDGPTSGVYEDWQDFDDETFHNVGFFVGSQFSERAGRSGVFGVRSAAANDHIVNSFHTEDNNDYAYATPAPQSDLNYEITNRGTYGLMVSQMPASARLVKKILCGNLNRISYQTRGAMSTVVNAASGLV